MRSVKAMKDRALRSRALMSRHTAASGIDESGDVATCLELTVAGISRTVRKNALASPSTAEGPTSPEKEKSMGSKNRGLIGGSVRHGTTRRKDEGKEKGNGG